MFLNSTGTVKWYGPTSIVVLHKVMMVVVHMLCHCVD